MKVLFLSRTEEDLHIGGIAEVIFHLTRIYPLLGIEPFVYTAGDSTVQSLGDALHNGTPCYSGPILKPGWASIFKRKKIQPLVKLIKELKIDLIQTCGLYRAGFVALQLKKMTKIPYVITSHGDILPTSSARIQRKSVKKRCKVILHEANAVTHLTAEMAEFSDAIFNTQTKSFIIPNGIDLAAWQNSKNLSEKNYMLAIGRLVPEKGFQVLLDAFAKLKKDLSVSLVIAGEGPAQNELEQQAKALGLQVVHQAEVDNLPLRSVCFTGNVKGEVKKDLFLQSRIILFATQPKLTEESFGLVPFEAFAAKKPLIASNLSRSRQLKQQDFQLEIVDESDNPKNWAEKMEKLLENERLRKQQSENNYKLIQQYDWVEMARQYKAVYSQVLR